MADSTADDGPTEKEPQPGLDQLFSDHAYSEILELILRHVGLSDTARLLRVNKHINQVFTSSSRLQLSYRKYYHAIPTSSTNIDNGGARRKPISEELQALLEKEERLESLKPTSIKCIHIPNSTMFESDSGYLLFGERMNKLRINPTDETAGYQLDSFSIWKLSSTENETEEKSRGGIKHQGYYRWRYNLGKAGRYNMITMCVEDNVVAVVREFNKRCCATLPPDSDVLSDFRVYLYQLLPPTDTLAPAKGTYEGATRHPEAAMGFIEVKLPARYHLHQMKAQLAPGGRVGLMLRPTGDADFAFLGVWDWKKGVSLGKIAPSPKPVFPDDFRFFGNFVLVSVFRTMEPPTPMGSKNSTSKSQLRHGKDRQNRSSDVAKKMSRGYKVRGRTGPIPSRHNRYVDDDDEEEDNDSDEGDSEAPKGHVYGFCSLEVYKTLDLSKGMKPSGFPYRAYTESGYDPSEPCTWNYQDIPICEPIVGFLSPPFNMMPAFPLSPIDMLLPPEPMICPSSCDLGEVHIDDALLKGERDGVMTFTILASTPGPGGSLRIQCQGVISLREIIHQVTVTLTRDHRARNMNEKDLATMWSQDLSVQKALNRQLQSAHDGGSEEAEGHEWETESDDERTSSRVSADQSKQGNGREKHRSKHKQHRNQKATTQPDRRESIQSLNGKRSGKGTENTNVMKYILS
ncbi:hypothetical protein V866_001325 [Kwoniella sp. B9012]